MMEKIGLYTSLPWKNWILVIANICVQCAPRLQRAMPSVLKGTQQVGM
jgi:hypothetical protein